MMKQQKALNGSKKAWAVKPLLLAACTLSFAGISTNAYATSSSNQSLVYEVYAGGIHAVQATLDIEIEQKNNRYSLELGAKTRGLLGKLAPWFGTFESHGWLFKDGNMRPEQHKSVATWRGEEQIKDYAYGKDGSFKSLTIDEHDKEPEKPDIDAEITDGTTDALTATLLVLQNFNETGKCEGSSLVFDGKRSFEQKFTHEEDVELIASKYNIYEGPAAKCTVEVVPKKGKWYEKPRGWLSIQEQGREKGTMPTVWIASIEEGAPAVPVKVFVKTDYGGMFMHLAEYKGAQKMLVAEKRITEEEEDEVE